MGRSLTSLFVDAIFFASYCGISRESLGQLVAGPVGEEPDLRCLSVRQAVNFAKSTNLLGVILEATTLVGHFVLYAICIPFPPFHTHLSHLRDLSYRRYLRAFGGVLTADIGIGCCTFPCCIGERCGIAISYFRTGFAGCGAQAGRFGWADSGCFCD